MNEITIAKRYAVALFDAAQEKKQTEIINQQLRTLIYLLENNTAFRQFFMDQSLSVEQKQSQLTKALATHFADMIMNFMLLLIEKRRENIIFHILNIFEKLWLEYLGILSVHLTTAKNISQEAEKNLNAALKQLFNKEIIFKYMVDPSLLGGAVIKIDDLIIDGSLKTRLDNMHKQITK